MSRHGYEAASHEPEAEAEAEALATMHLAGKRVGSGLHFETTKGYLDSILNQPRGDISLKNMGIDSTILNQ